MKEIEQQVGDVNFIKNENEEMGSLHKKPYAKQEPKLKKDILDLYSRIHKNQQDFNNTNKLKNALSPTNSRKLLQNTVIQLNQTDEKITKNNVKVVDWLNIEQNCPIKENLTKTHIGNIEDIIKTPKKDPPCFRKLAFNKNDIEKFFNTNKPSAQIASHIFETNSDNKSIGDYIIGKQIGEGAYAIVRDGINKKTSEKVAIKIYDAKRLKGGQKAKAVEREIKLLRKMKHKNIVGFHGAFRTTNHTYVVMEYIEGLNLRSYIRNKENKRLSENEARGLFRQILEGVSYCHKHEIAHRDIKLENILLDNRGIIKIIDFGFSTCIPNDQKLKLFCGTPSYMSPEIVSKKEYCGPPADVWALGILLYSCLTGVFPFKGIFQSELCF